MSSWRSTIHKNTANITYLLTPWYKALLEKLTGLQLVKKFPAFHGTRRFITALTSVRHLSLSWAIPIQFIYPSPTSWISILILSTHQRLGLPSGLLPSSFPSKRLYTSLSSPIRATCPAHLILLDFINRTILGEEYKSFSSSLCNLLHSPVTSSLLGPNILLNTMFSNTPSFLSSRNVNDQVSHPYKTTGKIVVLYILIFNFLASNLEDKRFCLILHSAKIQTTLITKIQVLWNTKPRLLVKICQCFEDLHTTFLFMDKYFQKNHKSIGDYTNLPARGFNIPADFRPHGKPKREPQILSTSFTVDYV